MEKAIKKLREGEEKQVRTHLEKTLTAAVNAKDAQKEAARHFSFRSWPPEVNREVMGFYINTAATAWRKEQRHYEDYKIGCEVKAPRGKAPWVEVSVEMLGEKRGGLTHHIRKGDTLKSIAASVYGDEAFAKLLIDSNSYLGDLPLGSKLPANYGLSCPQVWVPQRHGMFDWSVPSWAGEKAAEIPIPTMAGEYSGSLSKATIMEFGPFLLTITLEFTSKLTFSTKGTMSPKFSITDQKVTITKLTDDLFKGIKIGVSQKGGDISFEIMNTSVKGMTFKTTIDPTKRVTKVQLSPTTIKETYGDVTVEGVVEGTLTVKVDINPNFKLPPGLGPEAIKAWKELIDRAGAKASDASEWVHKNRYVIGGVALSGVVLAGALYLLPPKAKIAAMIAALFVAKQATS